MTSSQLLEHGGYFRDRRKLELYSEAIARVVKPGDIVIDLGSGSGLLGLLAAKAGAKRVYMIDSGPILGVSRDVVNANGFADVVEFVRSDSEDYIPRELADVILCDQIGGFVYDAGVLQYFADAQKRLLRPGGTMIPASFVLNFGLATAAGPRGNVDIWANHSAGLDTRAFHQLAVNTEWGVDGAEVTLVSEAATLGSIVASSQDPIKGSHAFAIAEQATVDGVVGWFDAELAPGVVATNRPDASDRINRWCNFYPLVEPIEVEPGDGLEVSIDFRPESRIVTWSTVWTRSGSVLRRWRQSTLLGEFLDSKELTERDEEAALHITPDGVAVQEALASVDGASTARAIIDKIASAHADAFVSPGRARRRLASELERWTHATP